LASATSALSSEPIGSVWLLDNAVWRLRGTEVPHPGICYAAFPTFAQFLFCSTASPEKNQSALTIELNCSPPFKKVPTYVYFRRVVTVDLTKLTPTQGWGPLPAADFDMLIAKFKALVSAKLL
jgi:hypothetical protein